MQETFEITDEDNIPQQLLDAFNEGQEIQCLTSIGWVDVEPDFRCGTTYRINNA